MPFPNEHAARIRDPAQYKRFRRQNDKFGTGIHAIFGITADGTAEVQSIRFDKEKFTVAKAKKWLADHDYKPIAFEPAEESKTDQPRGIERRIVPCDLELREDDGRTTVVGHAAVFYDGTPKTEFKFSDRLVERIDPKAFDRALEQDDVRALFNHNPDNLLGRTSSKTLNLSVDKRGLRYEIELGDTVIGQEVAKHLRRKDLTGSSFSFRVVPDGDEFTDQENGPTIRTLKQVRLFDVGPVTFPAYKGTDAAIRADGEESEIEAAYQRWLAAELAKKYAQERQEILREKLLDMMHAGI